MAEVKERGQTAAFGKLAAAALTGLQERALTVSEPRSTALTTILPMPPLTMPTTRDEARALAVWADSVPAVPVCVEPAKLGRHLKFMQTTLPSRLQDEESEKLRVAVFMKRLGEFSDEACAHMARRACDELEWFPSLKWCVEAAESYRGVQHHARTAIALAKRFTQQQFLDWCRRLRRGELEQADINAASPRWIAIADEQGLLRRDAETGAYVQRVVAADVHAAA